MMRLWALLLGIFLFACGTETPAPISPAPNVLAEPAWRELGRPLREAFGIAGPPPYYPGQEARRAWQLREAQKIGLSHYRFELKWHEIERSPGVFTWLQDEAIEEAFAHGQSAVGVIAYGNPLYSERGRQNGNSGFYPPDDPHAMAPFAAAAVEKYRGKIARWEFWNEPNGGYRFWKSAIGGEPARFAELAVVAARAMRKVDPKIKIALGGLFYHDYVVVPGAPRFLDAVLKARPELKELYDAVSYHPYKPYPPANPPEMHGSWDEDQDHTVDAMRAVMAKHGWDDKELWITENGWPTGGFVGEREQAQYLVRSALLAFARGVTEFDWYTFWDYENPASALVPPEAYFGLVSPGAGGPPFDYDDHGSNPPQKKLGFTALAVMLEQLGSMSKVADVSGKYRDMGARIVALEGASGKVLVAWQTAPNVTLVIPTPRWNTQAALKATGMLGETIELTEALTLTNNPVYLHYRP